MVIFHTHTQIISSSIDFFLFCFPKTNNSIMSCCCQLWNRIGNELHFYKVLTISIIWKKKIFSQKFKRHIYERLNSRIIIIIFECGYIIWLCLCWEMFLNFSMLPQRHHQCCLQWWWRWPYQWFYDLLLSLENLSP